MRILPALMLLSVSVAPPAVSQTAADHIAAGDRSYAALDARSALVHYEKAVAADARNHEALWKASRSSVDIGSYDQNASLRDSLFARAEQYARRSVALNPAGAEGHFSLARALGKTALSQSVRGRVKYATEIRARALECLRLDPAHAGCLHVMGMWNAEVMRLNRVSRAVAQRVLGGRVFSEASWKEAIRNMEAAVASEPRRIVHRVDLAHIYVDTGNMARARAEYEAALRLPVDDFNDPVYKEQARAGLAAIR